MQLKIISWNVRGVNDPRKQVVGIAYKMERQLFRGGKKMKVADMTTGEARTN